eukprot:12562355-Alexandrium_andersonii.AAC.1
MSESPLMKKLEESGLRGESLGNFACRHLENLVLSLFKNMKPSDVAHQDGSVALQNARACVQAVAVASENPDFLASELLDQASVYSLILDAAKAGSVVLRDMCTYHRVSASTLACCNSVAANLLEPTLNR